MAPSHNHGSINWNFPGNFWKPQASGKRFYVSFYELYLGERFYKIYLGTSRLKILSWLRIEFGNFMSVSARLASSLRGSNWNITYTFCLKKHAFNGHVQIAD